MSLNDCFKAPDSLITLDQAMEYLARQVHPVVGTETVPLAQAAKRVLAQDVVSALTLPPFACAAMDGFAFRHADLPGPFRVCARIAAGRPHDGTFAPGTAARIFTGAPMPADLDTMVMQEDVTLNRQPGEDGAAQEWVHIPPGVARGNFVRPAGEDFAAGTVVLPAGRRLRPQDVAMAAAVGQPTLTVYRRLTVGVFSTGDEVVEPGLPLPPGAVYACNRQGLLAMLAGLAVDALDMGNIPDDPVQTKDRLDQASRQCDLIITSGGVSVGGEDHVRDAVAALGAVHLWRLAIKPGKPTALGHVGKAAFVGLPGYPVSALVILMLVARAVILRLSGAVAEPLQPTRLPVTADFSFDKDHSRRQFLRANLVTLADGRLAVRPYRSQEPSVLSSLTQTDGLIEVAETTRAIRPGDLVGFLPYGVLQW